MRKRTGKMIACYICSKEIYAKPCLEKTMKTCSRECLKKWMSINAKKNGYGKWMTGRKLSKEIIEKMKSTRLKKQSEEGYISPYKGRTPWNKGMTWEEMFGKEKAKEIREKQSEKKGKRIEWLINYKHSKKTKEKIGIKSKKMWLLPDHNNKRFEKSHPKILIEKIIDLFESEKTLKEITKITKVSRPTLKRIILEKGFTEKDIKERANKVIGKNTKKHRKYQIFPIKDTLIEVKIQDLLKQLRIEFLTHQYMNIKYSYQCDIFIPKQEGINQKTIIECDGDYWHGNPQFPYYYNFPIKVKIQRIKDFERTNQLEEQGFRVIRFFGSEIKVMELKQLREKINVQK